MTSDLTQGKIFPSLVRLAMPIALGQVMHMVYNLLDMFWLGRYSNYGVASAGIAGLFIWLSVGLMFIGRVGAEVGVAQARGRGDTAAAYAHSRVAIYIAAVLGTLYGIFLLALRTQLVSFFNFQEAHVAVGAVTYTGIIALGMPAVFVGAAIKGTFVASGNARTPFAVSAVGLVANIALTPLLIFYFGMGVAGAAIASVVAQYLVLILSIVSLKWFKNRPFVTYNLLPHPHRLWQRMWQDLRYGTANGMFKLTLPVFAENTIFPLLTMITARFEVSFGAFALSMSRVGTQVESLSWLIGGGFGAALTAFVGQNFGAGKFERIAKGVKASVFFLAGWGLFVTLIMWFGAGIVMQIFLPYYAADPQMRALFVTYMRILAASQVFGNLEFVANNAFRGTGRTIPPSIISISSNIIRVPLAFVLSRTWLGVLGVWVAISFTSGLRGVVGCIWYFSSKKRKNIKSC